MEKIAIEFKLINNSKILNTMAHFLLLELMQLALSFVGMIAFVPHALSLT